MPLSIEAKRELVDEVSQVAATALSAVAAEYRGLTVGEMTELRAEARKSDVYLKVVKNTLAKRAVEGTEFECLQPSLSGPLILAFSREDPGAAARVIKGFAKEHDNLKTVAVALGGSLYSAADLDRGTADARRGQGPASRNAYGADVATGAHAGGARRNAGQDPVPARRAGCIGSRRN